MHPIRHANIYDIIIIYMRKRLQETHNHLMTLLQKCETNEKNSLVFMRGTNRIWLNNQGPN